MDISEILFYILFFVCFTAIIIIITYSEDLKRKSTSKNYILCSLLVGLLSFLLIILNWNYLCNYNILLLMFSPFLTIIITKSITKIFMKIFKKEPFNIDEIGLRNGIWVKNNGNLKERKYYAFYSTLLLFVPVLFLTSIFFLIRHHICQ